MNEWERMSRMAKRYKESYPPGTRILLLSMGDDPRQIEDNTRGTVKVVDDMATLHCSFDNGRQLGLVPGEDSFRKLTETELAEEQGIVALGDDCKIRLPKAAVDCSPLGFFDEMEEECWGLVQNYCNLLGVEMMKEDDGAVPVSFDIAKGIQDYVLGTLSDAGVKMNFDGEENAIDEENDSPVMGM